MQEEAQLTEWNRKLEEDTETLKAAANRQHLRMVCLECIVTFQVGVLNE